MGLSGEILKVRLKRCFILFAELFIAFIYACFIGCLLAGFVIALSGNIGAAPLFAILAPFAAIMMGAAGFMCFGLPFLVFSDALKMKHRVYWLVSGSVLGAMALSFPWMFLKINAFHSSHLPLAILIGALTGEGIYRRLYKVEKDGRQN